MSTSPINVLDRLLDPLTACLTPEVAGRIAHVRPDPDVERRLAELRAVVVVPGPRPGEPFTANLATGIAVVADDTW
jgi:hypothetical protein